MKKLVAVVLLLCVLVPCAVADTVNDFIWDYNINAGITGAEEISLENSFLRESRGHEYRVFNRDSGVEIFYNMNGIDGSCRAGADQADAFLRACGALAMTLGKELHVSNLFSYLLFDFYMAKADPESGPSQVGGYTFNIKLSDKYLFTFIGKH